MVRIVLLCFAAGAGLSGLPALATDTTGFQVTQKFHASGDGGFDYIVFEATDNRLYVSHGTEVNVLDAASGKELGKVSNTPGVHGIAIVPEMHLGFTTNGGDATVSVFDTQSFETLKRIQVGKDPDFTFYDPNTNRVLVCHGDGAEITAINPKKQSIAARIELGGGAEAAVVDDKGNGFVNLEESAEVIRFDTKKMALRDKWSITGCKTPTGLAMDTDNKRLFIGCRSKVLAVMDASSGKVITTLPIGERVDAVAYDKADHLIFASNGSGTISVIKQNSADDYESAGDIPTQAGAKTMAFDPKSQKLFLSTAEMETIPAPVAGQRPRSRPKPGTFTVLVVEKKPKE